jgi:hypothetical protein
MYLAGRASTERAVHAKSRKWSVVAWPLSTAALVLLSLTLGFLLAQERSRSAELLAAQQHGTKASPKSSSDESPAHEAVAPRPPELSPALAAELSRPGAAFASYVRLRSRVLDEGVEALPQAGGVPQEMSPMLTPRSSAALFDG